MPLTFIDIERRKNWRIGIFFLLLLLLYFIVISLLAAALVPFPLRAGLRFWALAGAAALLAAGVHFWSSAFDTVNTVIRSLDGQPPDRQDDVHKVFLNVMQEIHVVTGNKRRIRPLVIPSFSLNALAVADLRGNCAIGITEGLLSRLTRSQIEAVAAHEAHHILSGDCLETTVAAGIFGTASSAIEKLGAASRGRIFSSPVILIAWVLLKLSSLLNLFISREREYRADAAAVRMTRNPVALAEALHLLSRSWRGAGFIGSSLEMLCIVNPESTALDEREGFLADLLSTHPPLAARMRILLRMARIQLSDLDARALSRAKAGRRSDAGPAYYAMNPQQVWEGPFSQVELAAQPWLSALTWIAREKADGPVERAWKDPFFNAVFAQRLAGPEHRPSGFTCPSCRQPLMLESYEDTQIYQCRFCAGILAENDKIPRIIARTGRDNPCSARVRALARAVVNENQLRFARDKRTRAVQSSIPLLACPKCANPMYRGLYTFAHPVEIDRCTFCGLTWFDRDELAMLQCLIENRIVPDVTVPSEDLSAGGHGDSAEMPGRHPTGSPAQRTML